jgi:uncharacterized protein (DUF362 family)
VSQSDDLEPQYQDETDVGETSLDRRDFILKVGAALAATATLSASPDALAAAPKKPGKGYVLRVHHSGASTDITTTNDEVVKTLVAEALKRFTGAATAGEAMKQFVKPTDIVGVKINTLGSPFSSVNPATAFAVAEAVHAAGVPKDKVIIYDQYGSRMTTGGFRPLPRGVKPKPGAFPVHNHKTMGYETDDTLTEGRTRRDDPANVKLAKIARHLTAVINVCCPKDHDLTGVTGALKNVAYGNIETVPSFHCSREKCKEGCYHDGKCNIPRVYSHEQLGGKVRLVICDAVRVLYHGGPQDKRWRVAMNEIAISTDPVAVDRCILEWVETIRKEKGMASVWKDRDGTRRPHFIEGAGKMGLGEADLAKITQERVSLG